MEGGSYGVTGNETVLAVDAVKLREQILECVYDELSERGLNCGEFCNVSAKTTAKVKTRFKMTEGARSKTYQKN